MSNFIKKNFRRLPAIRTLASELGTQLYHLKQHNTFKLSNKKLIKDKVYSQYYLTKHYHVIEKGLALESPRLGFGQPKILDLLEKANAYEVKYEIDSITRSIRKTLIEYLLLHERNDFELPKNIDSKIRCFINKADSGDDGGLRFLNKQSASSLNIDEFRKFAQSRVSVRDFSDTSVSEETIYNAVDVAKFAPSVCNRQGWKVHCYSDRSKIRELLSYQNGNKGFTNKIDKLLIVTADDKAFVRFESNQPFIDGGLLSMNLLLALHASGLGACCLNTCMSFKMEKSVKKIASIPNNERLIMMIAVGNLKESYSVAYSNRKSTSDIFVSH